MLLESYHLVYGAFRSCRHVDQCCRKNKAVHAQRHLRSIHPANLWFTDNGSNAGNLPVVGRGVTIRNNRVNFQFRAEIALAPLYQRFTFTFP